MLEFILIAASVFIVVAVIVRSKSVFIRSIPYILYIYLFLLFFEESIMLLKIIVFTILLTLSIILILYKDFSQENLSENINSN